MPASLIPATVDYLLREATLATAVLDDGRTVTLREALSIWNEGAPLALFTDDDALRFTIPVPRVNATIKAYNLSRYGLEVGD